MTVMQLPTRTAPRTSERAVVLASADPTLRHRLRDSLTGLRWRVHEAAGGAEALTLLEQQRSDALLIDGWLPDLEASELAGHIALLYPSVDVLSIDGGPLTPARSPHRNELLHALREAQQPEPSRIPRNTEMTDTATWNVAPRSIPMLSNDCTEGNWRRLEPTPQPLPPSVLVAPRRPALQTDIPLNQAADIRTLPIPGLIGNGSSMRELTRLIRLVAPRNSAVLIEGETGTGKELVASAIHRLSSRAHKPLVVINCAAIPESLLEAELFGHTRGAFTGAVQARTGRIESAHGGTLFLDEIGELPIALQAKLLRFLECGEIQRIGDNDITRVDVRIIAATHRDLEQRVVEGAFRLDLYHRLAVFPLEVPALRERLEDLPALAEHMLARLGADAPRKSISAAALDSLAAFTWPGNVRELAHVLERAMILAGEAPEIAAEHIRVRRRQRP